eukprot:TRINITY_DN30087_c0_g1_i1.p1 TRINITY_DN30087_c0_g1~~TRINITY_DN30087_c0_g1_i1.p1  ORF type:complete len:304 (+),score=35.77 TRINITY_DN30087_c0_g1_i1:42-953(+)
MNRRLPPIQSLITHSVFTCHRSGFRELPSCFRGCAAGAGGHDILWSPGIHADESKTKRLAGKVGMLCRQGGSCTVGSKGELPTARAMRAIAKASEDEKAPIEFTVRWHEDPGGGRSLRFFATNRSDWSAFHRLWKKLAPTERSSRTSSVGPNSKPLPKATTPIPAAATAGTKAVISAQGSESKLDASTAGVFPVTPKTSVQGLALAMVSEERKHQRVALALNPNNDTVMSIAAKALATLPVASQPPKPSPLPESSAESEVHGDVSSSQLQPRRGHGRGDNLVCVLRWPRSHGQGRVYAHVFTR